MGNKVSSSMSKFFFYLFRTSCRTGSVIFRVFMCLLNGRRQRKSKQCLNLSIAHAGVTLSMLFNRTNGLHISIPTGSHHAPSILSCERDLHQPDQLTKTCLNAPNCLFTVAGVIRLLWSSTSVRSLKQQSV